MRCVVAANAATSPRAFTVEEDGGNVNEQLVCVNGQCGGDNDDSVHLLAAKHRHAGGHAWPVPGSAGKNQIMPLFVGLCLNPFQSSGKNGLAMSGTSRAIVRVDLP